jgi:sentrin-specific protease 1
MFLGKSIFKLGKLFIPINIGQMHWVCTMVNMVKKKIYMYDSMGGSGMSYLKRQHHSIHPRQICDRGAPLPDINEWEVVGRPLHVKIPNQENGELLLLPLCEWTVLGCVLL